MPEVNEEQDPREVVDSLRYAEAEAALEEREQLQQRGVDPREVTGEQ